jgi:uncharacterized SAM-binding protein YcdF (DUF218 family)
MSFLIVLLLAVGAALCAYFHRRRTANALVLLALAGVVLVGCGPLPSALLARLQGPYVAPRSLPWGQDNAIVLLGAGTEAVPASQQVEPGLFAYGRIQRAAAVYRECKQAAAHCVVVVSGGDARHTGRAEADAYAPYLNALGVPPADLVLEAKSLNTWQNAEQVDRLARQHHWDRVLLVSSGIHLQRSLLYFKHFGIEAVPVRADYLAAQASMVPLAINFVAMDAAIHEETGVLRFELYERMGWNAAAAPRPGAV